MKTLKTNIHYYSFPHSDGAGYNALWKELAATRKMFRVIPSNLDERYKYTNSVQPVELETKCLINNQWNTPTARVFDWFDAAPYSHRMTYFGHWLEITEEMEQVRRETQVCGYCGSHYGPHHEEHDDIPEEGFCTKCLSSEFLKDTELHLLRLLPVCDSSSAKRAPLTEEESAWLKLRYIDIQIEGNRQRAEGEKRAAIEEVTKKRNTAAIEYGGPAFPVPDSHHANGQVQYGANDMSLRDYFAGQALAGLVAHNDYGCISDQDVANGAYCYADAMLAAREVRA